MMESVYVMAGVIWNQQGQIFIAKRPDKAHQGGLWEFPGGKLEADEEPFMGLIRELKEELDIEVTAAGPLIKTQHNYADKSVTLDVWEVTEFEGQARGAEGQQTRWVKPQELNQLDFPAANKPIIEAVLANIITSR